MTRHYKALELLAENGYRLTAQRLMILSVLAEAEGHIEADEIAQRVRQTYPSINESTIYRTIQLLKRLHLLTEVPKKKRSRYHLAGAHRHTHMVCNECGMTLDLSPMYLKRFHDALFHDFGFEPDLEHFAISGLCADCQKKAKRGDGCPERRAR